jgi:20S proteasome alpha/beta subunit
MALLLRRGALGLGRFSRPQLSMPPLARSTTVLCVRKDDQVFMIADGQITLGSNMMKGNARKVRRLKDDVIVGFAGGTADALTLFERLEGKLQVIRCMLGTKGLRCSWGGSEPPA